MHEYLLFLVAVLFVTYHLLKWILVTSPAFLAYYIVFSLLVIGMLFI